ncbi:MULTISPECIES: hypothetical protein [Cupriavidus]
MNAMQMPTAWNWFTGYFDRTVTFCQSCNRKHPENIRRLLNASRVKPEEGVPRTSAHAAIRFIFGATPPAAAIAK